MILLLGLELPGTHVCRLGGIVARAGGSRSRHDKTPRHRYATRGIVTVTALRFLILHSRRRPG